MQAIYQRIEQYKQTETVYKQFKRPKCNLANSFARLSNITNKVPKISTKGRTKIEQYKQTRRV